MKRAFLTIGILILILTGFVVKTLYQAGQFKTIQPHFNGKVKKIDSVIGAEDITIHHSGMIFIAADDRFKTLNGQEGGKGGIYFMSIDNPTGKPSSLTEHLDFEIHPHGISLFQAADGSIYLYVVDHSNNNHSILLFRYDFQVGLNLVREFENDEYMISPNDVLGIDENRFYFTNDHGSKSGIGRFLEEYLQLKKSNVVYFDGRDYKIVAENIGYANGINMTANGKEVFVAGTTDRTIWVYNRDKKGGGLKIKDKVFLGTGVDNIEMDQLDNLWIGCHPKLLSFVAHSKDLENHAPSQVIKVWKDDHCLYQHKEVYLDDGSELSASSVAAVFGNNTMLIGPVFDDHLLWCELPMDLESDPVN